MSEWKPIEIAPKDGTNILAVRFDQSEVWPLVGAIVHWSKWEGNWFSPAVGHYLVPSHWMPLPVPPSQEG